VNAGEASQTAPGAASTSEDSQTTLTAANNGTANRITSESAAAFEKELRALLAEDPDLIFLYFDIANLYIQAGDRERAATVYQEGQQALADMLNERGYITQAAVPLIKDQFSNLYCLGYAASADSIEEAGTIMTTEQYKEALEEARRGVDLLPLSEEEKSAVQSAYEMYNGQLDECIEIRSEFQKVDLEAQLQVFADHRSEWDINRTESLPATSFTMADINNNGRLEVIVSGTTGTGIYSETYVFEVNEDATGLNRYSITDGTSPDIARMDSTEVYLVEGNYKISCTNATAHGWESADFEKQSLSLNDTGIIIETLGIGHRRTVINGDDELEYFDSDHNPISEAEFDSLYDSVYAGCPKGKMKFIWITPGYGGSMSLDQLRESWEGFSCSLY
jgi:tetratricopeptide (TPR) repeat protein